MGCKKLQLSDYFRWSDNNLPCRVRTPSKVYVGPNFPSSQNPRNTEFSTDFSQKPSSFVPEKFYYAKKAYSGFFKVPIDANGNMTSDGTWTYTWNEENRMVAQIKADDTKAEYTYDGLGRRRTKKVYSWVSSAWSLDSEHRYVYNGYKQVAELNGSNAVQKSYVWGKELLSATEGANTYFTTIDGNKNVTAYVDSSDNVVAEYTYGPFGNIVEKSGSKADDFAYRFSSEVFDKETGLVYYNFRYYNPELGRWLNRDPIQEWGGSNLYGFVLNNPLYFYDYLGNGVVGLLARLFGYNKEEAAAYEKGFIRSKQLQNRSIDEGFAGMMGYAWNAITGNKNSALVGNNMFDKAMASVREGTGRTADVTNTSNPSGAGRVIFSIDASVGYSIYMKGGGVELIRLNSGQCALYTFFTSGASLFKLKKVSVSGSAQTGIIGNVYEPNDYAGTFLTASGGYFGGGSASFSPSDARALSTTAGGSTPGASFAYRYYSLQFTYPCCENGSHKDPKKRKQTQQAIDDATNKLGDYFAPIPKESPVTPPPPIGYPRF